MEFTLGVQAVVDIAPVLTPSITVQLEGRRATSRSLRSDVIVNVIVGKTAANVSHSTDSRSDGWPKPLMRDDRSVPCAGVPLQDTKKRPAALMWHGEISDDDVRMNLPGPGIRFGSILRGDDVKSAGGKREGIHRARLSWPKLKEILHKPLAAFERNGHISVVRREPS